MQQTALELKYSLTRSLRLTYLQHQLQCPAHPLHSQHATTIIIIICYALHTNFTISCCVKHTTIIIYPFRNITTISCRAQTCSPSPSAACPVRQHHQLRALYAKTLGLVHHHHQLSAQYANIISCWASHTITLSWVPNAPPPSAMCPVRQHHQLLGLAHHHDQLHAQCATTISCMPSAPPPSAAGFSTPPPPSAACPVRHHLQLRAKYANTISCWA